jgi:hypothetical protein
VTKKKLPPAPKPPVQRWLVTDTENAVVGTVRDQFWVGARLRAQALPGGAEARSVGEEPADVRELAASMGLKMREGIDVPVAHTETMEEEVAKLKLRVSNLERAMGLVRNKIGGGR